MTSDQGFFLTVFFGVMAIAILVVPPYFMYPKKNRKD